MALDIEPPMAGGACRSNSGLRRSALRLRGTQRFGPTQVLREMVDADHLVAQLRGALERRRFLAGDHLRGERSLSDILAARGADRARLLRGAYLRLDRLGVDRRGERRLDRGERVARVPGHV